MELSNDEVLKEKVKHGTQSFPLQIYHDIEFYDKGLIFYSHWHEEAEILYVVEGELELVVDDVSIFAKTNTVILIPPNLLHTAYQCNHKKCKFTSIVFHQNFIESKTDDNIQKILSTIFTVHNFAVSYVLKITDRNNRVVLQLLREFEIIYFHQQPFSQLLMKGYLYQILYHLLQQEKKHTVKSITDYINEDRRKKILSFIAENYQEPVTLKDMAANISLSKEQFCRFFKASFRSTPMKFLNQYRINRSMELLKETNLSIIDISLEVGFDSSNYFSIIFKKVTGITPSQFRKMP